jgi:hypothetical protein
MLSFVTYENNANTKKQPSLIANSLKKCHFYEEKSLA